MGPFLLTNFNNSSKQCRIFTMKKVYHIPYLGYHTRAYVVGDLSNGIPLIILHGGPGGCVERYEVLEQLAEKGIPLIFYDQLGCGYSRVPKGNEHLWTFETYLKELENVISFFNLKKFSILGHSWGGMLALEWVTKYEHHGLDKLVLFSTLPSTKIPRTNKEIYRKMWGFSELFGNGTLSNYDVTNLLHKVDVPTLILSGKFDESTPTMNKVMNKKIPGSRWVLLEHSHHGGYNEEPEIVLSEIEKFIK